MTASSSTPGWPDPSGEFGPRDSIVAYLLADASRLEAELAEARAYADEGFLAAARKPFAAYTRRLERHIRLAERAVLPRLPARLAEDAATLRLDHDHLRARVEVCARWLDARNAASFARAIGRLSEANRRHEHRERRILAPARELI